MILFGFIALFLLNSVESEHYTLYLVKKKPKNSLHESLGIISSMSFRKTKRIPQIEVPRKLADSTLRIIASIQYFQILRSNITKLILHKASRLFKTKKK